jgi:hypothetical protein
VRGRGGGGLTGATALMECASSCSSSAASKSKHASHCCMHVSIQRSLKSSPSNTFERAQSGGGRSTTHTSLALGNRCTSLFQPPESSTGSTLLRGSKPTRCVHVPPPPPPSPPPPRRRRRRCCCRHQPHITWCRRKTTDHAHNHHHTTQGGDEALRKIMLTGKTILKYEKKLVHVAAKRAQVRCPQSSIAFPFIFLFLCLINA